MDFQAPNFFYQDHFILIDSDLNYTAKLGMPQIWYILWNLIKFFHWNLNWTF